MKPNMKIYKITIDAYVSAEAMERAMDFVEEIEPPVEWDWDSYTVHPPIEVVDYGPIYED